MIEHEINELEDKWQDYKNRKKIVSTKTTAFSKKKFFTLLFILLIIGVVIFAIYSEDEFIKEQKSRIINVLKNFNNSPDSLESTYEIAPNKNLNTNDDFLNLNDLEVMISEDGAGFERIIRKKDEQPTTIKEIVYMPSAYPMPIQMPTQMPLQQQVSSNNYAPAENQEIISFQGYPDSPNGRKAQSATTQVKQQPSKTPAKLQIQTKQVNGSAIDKMIEVFNKTKNPNYAIMLSDEFYAQKKYADAEKWALTANDLNKDDAKSWIAFAKAKYQQGAKTVAIDVLKNYNSRMPNDAVATLIRDMQAGAF